MLKIRPEQLEVFQRIAEDAFVEDVIDYLVTKHADCVVQLPNKISTIREIPQPTLCKIVRNGIARAKTYHLNWQSNLITFVVLMFVAAPNFDEQPLIKQVLTSEKAEPDSRIDQLLEITTEENWEEARQNYDVSAWFLGDPPGITNE